MAAEKLVSGKNVAQYGMKFLLNNLKKVNLNDEIAKDVLTAICYIHYHEPQETVPVPDEEADVTDEQREKIQEQNEEIEKSNDLFQKLKQFVQIVTPTAEEGEEP